MQGVYVVDNGIRRMASRPQARRHAGRWTLLHPREMAVVKETGLVVRITACLGAALIALAIAALPGVDPGAVPESIAAVSLASDAAH
jgi:hypothetical protein